MSLEPMLLDQSLHTQTGTADAPGIGGRPDLAKLPEGKILAFNFIFDPTQDRPTDVWQAISSVEQVIEGSGNMYRDRLEALRAAEEQTAVLRQYMLELAKEGRHVYTDGKEAGHQTFEFQVLGKRYTNWMTFISFLGPFRYELEELASLHSLAPV